MLIECGPRQSGCRWPIVCSLLACHSLPEFAGPTSFEADAKLKVHACPAFGADLSLCAWPAAAGHCLQMFHSFLALVYGTLEAEYVFPKLQLRAQDPVNQ